MSYTTPNEGAAILEHDARQSARIHLTTIGRNGAWLRGRNPHAASVARDAVFQVVRSYRCCGYVNAEHIRDGVRLLIEIKGADAMQAMAQGISRCMSTRMIEAVGLGGSDVRYRPAADIDDMLEESEAAHRLSTEDLIAKALAERAR